MAWAWAPALSTCPASAARVKARNSAAASTFEQDRNFGAAVAVYRELLAQDLEPNVRADVRYRLRYRRVSGAWVRERLAP